MQITTYLHTYRWIGDYWGKLPVCGWIMEMERDGTITLKKKGCHNVQTCHTILQLEKLGYMELIETKPCEHKAGNPVYLVDGKLTCSRCHLPYEENWCEQKHYRKCKEKETKPEEKLTEEEKRIMEACKPYVRGTSKIDHDKAMEIPEVPEYEASKTYCGAYGEDYEQDDCELQVQAITNSLNAVIRYLKSK